MTDDAYKEVFYNLPKENGIGREKDKIGLDIDSTCEIFELGDRSACIKCKKDNSSFADCNEKVLKVNPCNHRLVIVNHEDYISQFNGKKFAEGGRCDLLLFDTEKHKIAFCELGCYSEIYVETKKSKSSKANERFDVSVYANALRQGFCGTICKEMSSLCSKGTNDCAFFGLLAT